MAGGGCSLPFFVGILGWCPLRTGTGRHPEGVSPMIGSRIVLLCSAVVLPQMAVAGLPDTNPAGLGNMNAYLPFCTEVDRKDPALFQAEWDSIVSSGTSQELKA